MVCFLLNRRAADDVNNLSMRRPRASVREEPKSGLCALRSPTDMDALGS